MSHLHEVSTGEFREGLSDLSGDAEKPAHSCVGCKALLLWSFLTFNVLS